MLPNSSLCTPELRVASNTVKQFGMFSQGDRSFVRGLKSLPAILKDAIFESELDDPVVLRSFRPSGMKKLGMHEGGKRAHLFVEPDIITDGMADIEEFLTAADGGVTEGKFPLDDSAGSLANLLSGTAKKQRTTKQSKKGQVAIESR